MNLPNFITICRIVLVPIFVSLFFRFDGGINFPATVVFLLAALTDMLDGYLARKRKEVTRFGQLIDPIADKLLVTSALLVLIESGQVSTWVALIIIGREFAVSGLRLLAAAEGRVVSASIWGKLKTISQIVAVMGFLLQIPWAPMLMYVATIITLGSGVDYFLQAQNILKSSIQ